MMGAPAADRRDSRRLSSARTREVDLPWRHRSSSVLQYPSSSPITRGVSKSPHQVKSVRYERVASTGSGNTACSSGVSYPNLMIMARACDSPPFSLLPSANRAIAIARERPLWLRYLARRLLTSHAASRPVFRSAESAMIRPSTVGKEHRQSKTVHHSDVTCTPSMDTRSAASMSLRACFCIPKGARPLTCDAIWMVLGDVPDTWRPCTTAAETCENVQPGWSFARPRIIGRAWSQGHLS